MPSTPDFAEQPTESFIDRLDHFLISSGAIVAQTGETSDRPIPLVSRQHFDRYREIVSQYTKIIPATQDQREDKQYVDDSLSVLRAITAEGTTKVNPTEAMFAGNENFRWNRVDSAKNDWEHVLQHVVNTTVMAFQPLDG